MNSTAASSVEADTIGRLRGEERRRALRALLRQPLLLAENPGDQADFARVRRQAEELREWFHRYAGWTLDVTSDCARLYKTPATLTDGTRPARNPKDGEPFSRRRYVLFCLSVAALVKSERQTTLGSIAQAIIGRWNDERAFADRGLTFDLNLPEERRDLVAVIRILLELHAIVRVDGDEHRFVQNQEADVLYDVHHFVVARLLAARQPPSAIAQDLSFEERLAALVTEPVIDDEEQRNQRTRTSLIRRLLDDPVIYTRELSLDEQEYLPRQRPHLLRLLVEATGLEPEDRDEGIALANATGECTDLGLPEEGTDGHATLLTAEYLAGRRLEAAGEIVPIAAVEDFLATRAAENRRFWRKATTEPGAERELARGVIARLAGLSLVCVLTEGLVVMPAIHRYRHELRSRPPAAPTTD